MAYLKSTTVAGKLSVAGDLETASLTMNGATVTGITSATTDTGAKLATAKFVVDYITTNTGKITNNTSGGSSSGTINAGSQIKIGKGYYANDVYYTASAAQSLSGDATAAQVLSGKTFYNNSYTKQTGTMPNNGATGGTITTQGGTYTIPAGYTSGGTVTASIGSGSITANNPTVSPTHGAITPSVGGTVTTKVSTVTTTKPSGTDGTDYVTIDPSASITTQPKATPTYTYSATAGYIAAVSSTTKTGTATNITPTVNAGTNYYLPKQTPKFDGGGLSGGGLSGGGLTITTNYSGTPTVTLATSTTTASNGTKVGCTLVENASGVSAGQYYVTIKGSTAKLTGTTKATRAAVTRAKVDRAAVLYNGAVNGWVNIADNTSVLTAGSIAADSTTIPSTSVSPTVTVNAASDEDFFVISTEEKTVSPTSSQQVISPSSGKLMSKVTVGAISSDYVYKPDLSYISIDSIQLYNNNNYRRLVYNNKLHLFTYNGYLYEYNNLTNTLTQSSITYPTWYHHTNVGAIGNTMIAIGAYEYDGGEYYRVFNGTSWTDESYLGSFDGQYSTFITVGTNLYLVINYNGTGYIFLWNGTSFTSKKTFSLSSMVNPSVATDGVYLYIIGGSTNKALYKFDGTNITTITSSLPAKCNGICYLNGELFALMNKTIYKSTTGTSWTIVTSTTPESSTTGSNQLFIFNNSIYLMSSSKLMYMMFAKLYPQLQ